MPESDPQPRIAMDIELTFPDCPLCGSREMTQRFVARDRLVGMPGEFPVVECARCGFVFLKPRPAPDALVEFYPDAYYPIDSGQETPEALAVARGLLTRVNAWTNGRNRRDLRVLDIGCGTGLFLKFARDAGYRVQGLELSQPAVDYARHVYGLPVDCGELTGSNLPDESFDVVIMWHVLEHLSDPVGGLRMVRRILKPGGMLLFGVPNIASQEARVFGRRWFSLDAPRHLVHFSPETAELAVAHAGLRVDRIVHSSGTAGLVYSIMGDLTGISLRLRGEQLSNSAYRRIANILSWLARPVCVIAANARQGGAIEVYAEKPVA